MKRASEGTSEPLESLSTPSAQWTADYNRAQSWRE